MLIIALALLLIMGQIVNTMIVSIFLIRILRFALAMVHALILILVIVPMDIMVVDVSSLTVFL
ncbi:hypothetical protein D3C80_1417320 [compost metagenome]